MKVELTIGVYSGDDLVDTISYVVDSSPLSRIFSMLPEDSVDVSVTIEGIKELYE
jgi:hypothetical protein